MIWRRENKWIAYYFLQVYPIHNAFFFLSRILILVKDVHLVYYETNLNVLLVLMMKCYILCCFITMKWLYYTDKSFHLLIKL